MKKTHDSQLAVYRIPKQLSNCRAIQPASPAKRGELSNRRRWRPGVTLVELLLYMSLVSIFIVTLTDIFASILNVRTESEATSAVEVDGRFILARLNYDISRASTIITPSPIGATSPSLSMDIGGVTYTYSLSASNLQLVNNLDTNNINGSETIISALSFQRIANASIPGTKDTIRVQLTLDSKTQRPSGPEVRTFTTTIGRR